MEFDIGKFEEYREGNRLEVKGTKNNLALGFMIIAFIVGPKVPILNDLINSLGQYLQNFVQDSLTVHPFENNS